MGSCQNVNVENYCLVDKQPFYPLLVWDQIQEAWSLFSLQNNDKIYSLFFNATLYKKTSACIKSLVAGRDNGEVQCYTLGPLDK